MQTEEVKDEVPPKSPVERHRDFKAGGMYAVMFFQKYILQRYIISEYSRCTIKHNAMAMNGDISACNIFNIFIKSTCQPGPASASRFWERQEEGSGWLWGGSSK